ncbi:hypothetical protein SVAN01_02927 [Stagonosporopsis vannaccii]|nr:hypothetical protein SVAN01_02927 [Stagonosporopsis vannaccii]
MSRYDDHRCDFLWADEEQRTGHSCDLFPSEVDFRQCMVFRRHKFSASNHESMQQMVSRRCDSSAPKDNSVQQITPRRLTEITPTQRPSGSTCSTHRRVECNETDRGAQKSCSSNKACPHCKSKHFGRPSKSSTRCAADSRRLHPLWNSNDHNEEDQSSACLSASSGRSHPLWGNNDHDDEGFEYGLLRSFDSISPPCHRNSSQQCRMCKRNIHHEPTVEHLPGCPYCFTTRDEAVHVAHEWAQFGECTELVYGEHAVGLWWSDG